MKFERDWGQPTKDTFSCPPIKRLVKRYLKQSKVSVDCFARDNQWATYTNDLNPKTKAQYHMDVTDFLLMLVAKGVKADVVLFDPPFSPRQLKECYEESGFKFRSEDAWRTANWTKEKILIHQILTLGGYALSFGWNTNGFGSANQGKYELEEILLVCHGSAHNDTICMVERKVDEQLNLF